MAIKTDSSSTKARGMALVCGAGAAGLGAAAMLKATGFDVTVLERAKGVAASWRVRYDSLWLNTPGRMSELPGLPAHRDRYGEFPTRDNWVRYLEDYAAHHDLHIQFESTVLRVDKAGDQWRVETSTGPVTCDVVVIALGHDRVPHLPTWPGRESYRRTLIHVAEYRNPDPFRGKDVLVVGTNVSGTEVAHELACSGVSNVHVACRTPPNFVRRKLYGVSVNVYGIFLELLPRSWADLIARGIQRLTIGDLSRYGLPAAPDGPATTLHVRHQAAAYDNGFIKDLKSGRIKIVPAVTGFDGEDVLLANDQRIRPDVVIAATGFRNGLEPILGHLGVLDNDERPRGSRGEQLPDCRGLFFNGYRANMTGQLRLMRLDAIDIARAAVTV